MTVDDYRIERVAVSRETRTLFLEYSLPHTLTHTLTHTHTERAVRTIAGQRILFKDNAQRERDIVRRKTVKKIRFKRCSENKSARELLDELRARCPSLSLPTDAETVRVIETALSELLSHNHTHSLTHSQSHTSSVSVNPAPSSSQRMGFVSHTTLSHDDITTHNARTASHSTAAKPIATHTEPTHTLTQPLSHTLTHTKPTERERESDAESEIESDFEDALFDELMQLDTQHTTRTHKKPIIASLTHSETLTLSAHTQSFSPRRVREEEREEDLLALDLNRVSEEENLRAKALMNNAFESNRLKPGDEGFVYDKQMDFAPCEDNEWDEDEDD